MAVPLCARFSNLRNILKINNNVVCTSANKTQFLKSVFRSCSTKQDKMEGYIDQTEGLSKAMRAYMERAQKYKEFMEEETLQYEIGKRHLANMMGLDPEQMTQKDISASISYLFPSGLYDRKARPMMKHPTDTFPPQKEAEFGADGKPFHTLFYTTQPNFYEILRNIVERLQHLDDLEDKYIKSHGTLPPVDKINIIASEWISKKELEKRLIETMTDENYEYIIKTLSKVQNHRLSKQAEDFILKYKIVKSLSNTEDSIIPVAYDAAGRPFVKVFPCKRKSAVATVKVWGKGTGKITINGKDISYFHDLQSREAVSFFISIPFSFLYLCLIFIKKKLYT